METENTALGSLSMQDAVQALVQSRQDQATPEATADEPEAEAEEVSETPEPEALEAEEEGEDDQPEADADDEAETEEADQGEDFYEINGEVFSYSELQEWKNGALRQADYTKKTQQLSADREVYAKEREAFEAERGQAVETLQQERAQLQEALTYFAIEQPQKPSRQDFADGASYDIARDQYEAAIEKKQQAAQVYQALRQQEQRQNLQEEVRKTLNYIPEWGTDEGWKTAVTKMAEATEPFGISAEEIQNQVASSHKMARLMNDYLTLKAQAADRDATRKAAAKKVTKVTKRLTPSGKASETQQSKSVREKQARAKKTGSLQDAAAFLAARRSGKT